MRTDLDPSRSPRRASVLRTFLPAALLLVASSGASTGQSLPPFVQSPSMLPPADVVSPSFNETALPPELTEYANHGYWARESCAQWARKNGKDPRDPASYHAAESASGHHPKHCQKVMADDAARRGGGGGGGSSGGGGTSPNAPNLPSDPAPANGATGITRWSPGLTWTGGDPDGGSLTYDIYFGPTNPPAFQCSTPWTAGCSTGTLNPGTAYYWKIKAKDSSHVTEGPVWSFTSSHMANTPSSPSPAVGATNVNWAIPLSWSGGDPDGQSVWYTVKGRYGSGSFGNVCSTSSTSCTWNTAGRGIVHEWYVQASKQTSGTVTGPTWSFTTKPNTPPSICIWLTASYLDLTATNTCADADGDYVTYTFNWNDGTPTSSTGGTGSYNAQAHHYGGTAYCPTGTATVQISAWDGYDASTGSQNKYIEDWGHHSDGDGLIDCREELQGTSTTDIDADDDSLDDYVESEWWPSRDSVFCLPGNTATNPGCVPNPLHKDLYVEMDYVSPTIVDASKPPSQHLPDAVGLEQIVDVFRQAPVSNPAGGNGITLHLDTGSIYPAYDLGRGNDVGSHDGMLTTSCLGPFWTAYDNIRDTHFTPNGRTGYFHYALWLDQVCEGAGGLARGVPDRNMAIEGYGSPDDKQHDFVHELGHLLGLHHGGEDGEANYKPNYISAMNYRDHRTPDNLRFFGYSTVTLQSMSESSIRENKGFGQSFPLSQAEKNYLDNFIVTYSCPDGTYKKLFPSDSKSSVDFNCDETVTTTGPVMANVNGRTQTGEKVGTDDHDTLDPSDDTVAANDCLGPSSTAGCEDDLHGFTDWSAIVFTGLARSHSYGAWGGETPPDSFIYDLPIPREVCVPSLAGGLRCTQVI